MKELLEVIAKRLVEHPEQVVVAETNNERALILELKVAPEDMGKSSASRQNCKGNPHCGKSRRHP